MINVIVHIFYLLTFCLLVPSVAKRGEFKTPAVILELFLPLTLSVFALHILNLPSGPHTFTV